MRRLYVQFFTLFRALGQTVSDANLSKIFASERLIVSLLAVFISCMNRILLGFECQPFGRYPSRCKPQR